MTQKILIHIICPKEVEPADIVHQFDKTRAKGALQDYEFIVTDDRLKIESLDDIAIDSVIRLLQELKKK